MRTQHPSHFVQRLVLPSFGSKPIGAIEKILLVDGVKQFHHRFLHDLVLQGGNRDRSLFPVFLGDIDSPQWLALIFSILEPLMELADVSLGVPFVLLVRYAVYPSTGFPSQTLECHVQFSRCD